MLEGVLEAKLSMFLIALLVGMSEENQKAIQGGGGRDLVLGGYGVSALANYNNYGQAIEDAKNKKRAEDLTYGSQRGSRDFGGEISVTGMYRLQKGETVERRGQGGGKTTTVNASININGANDPKAVAAAVRSELYRLSEKH